MTTQAQRNEVAAREDRQALWLGVRDASDDLLLWVRGLRRRGLDRDEYEWALDRLAEIRRDAERLKDGADNDYSG